MNISRAVMNELIVHARESWPEECCGLLLGDWNSIVSSARAVNRASTPRTRFLLDPQDHFNARRAARTRHLDVVGFYHSHPATSAQPSESDLAEWTYDEFVSVIVSLQAEPPIVRAFTWREQILSELALAVAEAEESERGSEG